MLYGCRAVWGMSLTAYCVRACSRDYFPGCNASILFRVLKESVMSVTTADKRLFPRTNDFFSRPSPVSTLEQHVVPLEQYVVPSPRPPRSNLKGHIHDVEGEGGNVVMVVVGWPAPASNHQCRPLLQCGNPGGPGGSYMGHWFLCRGNHRWACIAWACPDREPLPHRERDGMHPSPHHQCRPLLQC